MEDGLAEFGATKQSYRIFVSAKELSQAVRGVHIMDKTGLANLRIKTWKKGIG